MQKMQTIANFKLEVQTSVFFKMLQQIGDILLHSNAKYILYVLAYTVLSTIIIILTPKL